ncbi:hypothetical protein [Massilia sp. TSP1-1-2]
MPSKSFAIGSVVFGLLWATFFYPPGPKRIKPLVVVQQIAQAR